MPDERADEQYVAMLTRNQRRLYAFLVTLLGSRELADECLQNTNMVLWRKAGEFEPGTNFEAWSTRVAELQARALRKRVARDRVLLNDSTLDALASQAATGDDTQPRLEALRRCLEHLSPRQFGVLRVYYGARHGLEATARALGLSVSATKSLLHRTRAQILECVQRRLAGEGAP